jgi:anthranilate/para-aminobenzoate synthase component II
MKFFVCDFEDSFTYNIYSELLNFKQIESLEVIAFNSLNRFLSEQLLSTEKVCLIFGPGPGSPMRHGKIIEILSKLLSKENVFIVGICLGHQLIWKAMGANISKCQTPMHGLAVEYELTPKIRNFLGVRKKIKVQRYNSLAVKLTKSAAIRFEQKEGWTLQFQEDELIISLNTRVISYQFHPESIGTSFPKLFFEPLLKFLL